MDLTAILSEENAQRAQATLEALRRHDVSRLALTGGLAIELQLLRRGLLQQPRPLNDIDFLAAAFSDIPSTLASGFLFRHVHPYDPPGKTLLQAASPKTSVRVDVFRAYGREMERTEAIEIVGAAWRVVSLADLIARTARLCLDLASNTPIPAKHARDFLRMLPLADRESIEPIWQEHRKPSRPESFAEAAAQLEALIPLRRNLQIEIEYSRDVNAHCSRCEATAEFPLADAATVLSLLGYC